MSYSVTTGEITDAILLSVTYDNGVVDNYTDDTLTLTFTADIISAGLKENYNIQFIGTGAETGYTYVFPTTEYEVSISPEGNVVITFADLTLSSFTGNTGSFDVIITTPSALNPVINPSYNSGTTGPVDINAI